MSRLAACAIAIIGLTCVPASWNGKLEAQAGHLGGGGGTSASGSSTTGTGIASGNRVMVRAAARVHANASSGSSVRGSQEAGRLGTVTGGPVSSGGTSWWNVNFETGADGWTRAGDITGAYFPPPRGSGDWRALVRSGQTPSAATKSAIRAKGGVDWDRLKRAYDYSRSYNTGSSVLVIRNGYVVGEWGSTGARKVNSISKSLTGLSMARLFDMSGVRQIGPESYAHEFLPDSWERNQLAKRQIRVRHLLTMTSGLRPHDRPGGSGYTNTILGLPLDSSPGSIWAYASAPVDLLSLVVENASGRKLRDLFNQQIAGPIGAPAIRWDSFDSHTGASSKAYIAPRDLARVGYLMMMDGRWGGGGGQRSVVGASRINALEQGCSCGSSSFGGTAGSPFNVGSNSKSHYGQLLWTNRGGVGLGSKVPSDAFYMHGLRENLLIVVPSRNLIVVRLGDAPTSMPQFRVQLMSRIMDALVSATSIAGLDRPVAADPFGRAYADLDIGMSLHRPA